MSSIFKKYKFQIIGFLVFATVFLTISIKLLTPKKQLPVMNPSDVNPELVQDSVQYVSKYHTIPAFSFINQNEKTVTDKDYADKIYVADFFFTTCQTICPIMTNNMVDVQNAFRENPKVMLLSHTINPEQDSVSVLKKYAIDKGVIDQKWNLVTGTKRDIFYIARKSYLIMKTGKPSEMYDMVHTENLALIDTKKRIRGFYDGTNKDDTKRLIEDIKWLLLHEE